MATTKFSGIGVVDLNGSVGNMCFSRNFYGTYAKNKPPQPTGSAFLTAWQTEVASLTNVWEFGMDDMQRAEWYKYALLKQDAMADRNKITGFQLFMSVNLNLFLVLAPQVTAPPISQELPQSGPLAINTLTTTQVKLFLSDLPDCYGAIYATKPLPPGRMSNNQIYAYILFSFMSIGVIDFSASYITHFGLPVSGQKIFFKCIPISQASGKRGIPQYTSGIVA